jgi:hypothetical protein
MLFRLTLLEIFLLQLALWLALWLLDDYLATLLTIIVGAIVSAVLVIALLAEAIERSRVPRRYFWIMALTLLAPLTAALTYTVIFGGELAWVSEVG